MGPRVDAALERRVRERAGRRCEYCQLPDDFSSLPFQVDHIVARKHGGPTRLENLALACFYCNTHKGPNIAGRDVDSQEIVRLYNPRMDDCPSTFDGRVRHWSG